VASGQADGSLSAGVAQVMAGGAVAHPSTGSGQAPADSSVRAEKAAICLGIKGDKAMQEEQTNLAHLLEILRQRLPELTERYRVKSLGVFGSYLRQEQRPDSDLDLLVAFDEPPSLLTFIELETYLADLLGVKVDLVMQSALKPRIGERILSEVVPV
jgi:predicted nucleotidyltransferase